MMWGGGGAEPARSTARVCTVTRARLKCAERTIGCRSRAAAKAGVRIALDPLKHVQRRPLGAFGVAPRYGVRAEARCPPGGRVGVGRSNLRAAQRFFGSANRLGSKPPALTAQADI